MYVFLFVWLYVCLCVFLWIWGGEVGGIKMWLFIVVVKGIFVVVENKNDVIYFLLIV